MKKNLLKMPVSLLVSHVRPNLAQILPKGTPTLIFFAGFQWNMLRGSIDINNFNWLESGSSEKVLLKPLKLLFFDPTFAKMESLWATSKTKKHFFFQK